MLVQDRVSCAIEPFYTLHFAFCNFLVDKKCFGNVSPWCLGRFERVRN